MKKIDLSLFLPVYNESALLKENLPKIINFCQAQFRNFEIYIVDDNSSKKVSQDLEQTQFKKKIKYLRFDNGPSRRENLALAFRNAKFDKIFLMDIDLTPHLDYLLKCIDSLDLATDIVIGSRYAGIQPERTLDRLIISKIYNFSLRLAFNSKVYDHQCGFKLFKKDKLFIVLDKLGYDKSFTRGWFWDAELLIRAQRTNMKIKEVPMEWVDREIGKSSFNFLRELRMLPKIIKLFYEFQNE